MQATKRNVRESYLGFIFKDLASGPQHCKGVKALLSLSSMGLMLTGGKDGVIKQWDSRQLQDAHSQKIYLTANLVDHIDWVNRLRYAQKYEKLISCSNDSSIRLWDIQKLSNQEEPSSPVTVKSCEVFGHHNDFVQVIKLSFQAMDYIPFQSTIVSQDFEGKLLFLDLQQWKTQIVDKPRSQVHKNMMDKSYNTATSSYTCLSASAGGNILCVAQQTDTLNAIDLRDQLLIRKIQGHKGSVRQVITSRSGKMCLSASSDHTVKLWDIAYKQCMRTISCHTSSVLSIAVNFNFSKVYSGGRDGCIFCTDLTDQDLPSVLLHDGDSPIVKLQLDQGHHFLWAADEDGDWFSLALDREAEGGLIQIFRMESRPGIKQTQVLKNRQFMIVQRDKREAEIWDIPRGERVDFLKRDTKINISRLSEYLDCQFPCKTQSWFSSHFAMGDLTIQIDNIDSKQGLGKLFEYKRDKLKFDEQAKATPATHSIDKSSAPINLADVMLRKFLSGWVKQQIHQDFKEVKTKLGSLFVPQLFHKRISDKYPLLLSLDMPIDIPDNVLIYQRDGNKLAGDSICSIKAIAHVPDWVNIYQPQISAPPNTIVQITVLAENDLELPNLAAQKRKIPARAMACVILLVRHIAKGISLWNYVDSTEAKVTASPENYLEITMKGEALDNSTAFYILQQFTANSGVLELQYRKKKVTNLLEI